MLGLQDSGPIAAIQIFGRTDDLSPWVAIGAPIPPIYRADYERAVAAARTQAVEKDFAAAWTEGRNMTSEAYLVTG